MKQIRPSKMLKNIMSGKFSRVKMNEMDEISYKPKSVKDLLIEMKDKSELIVDLAYSALIFDSPDLAAKVMDIEIEMDELLFQVRISAILGARDVEEAEQLSGLLQFANAVESISDAAMNLVDVFYSKGENKILPVIPFFFDDADEKMGVVILSNRSPMSGKRIRDLMVESETGVRIIAIKRRDRWLYDVGGGTTLHSGDYLLLRGVEMGLKEVGAYARGKAQWGRYQSKPGEGVETHSTSKGMMYMMEMKNLSELMVDLAVSSLLYNNKEIAEEVYILYHNLSKLHGIAIRYMITNLGAKDVDLTVNVISLLNGMYDIGDSAKNIANVVMRDIEPHPIIRQIVSESDVAILRIRVMKNAPIEGETLGSIKLASETGMWMFAVKRGDSWIFGPNEGTRIMAGDTIFLKGPTESFDMIYELAGCVDDSCLVNEGD